MSSSDAQPTQTGRASRTGEASLMCTRAGGHEVVFDLRTLLSVEGDARIEHEAIRGPIDLRTLLGGPGAAQGDGESLLVLGGGAVYRVLVDVVAQLVHLDVSTIHPVPDLLAPLTRRLSVAGVVEKDGGHAFLLDPTALARAAEGAR